MAFGKQGSRRLKIVEWTDHEKAAALWARRRRFRLPTRARLTCSTGG
jgi:hypothetical protein